MITVKTTEEIEIIRQGGKLLAQALDKVLAAAKPGVTTRELDELAEKLIIESGGVPAFKHYKEGDEPPFPSTICASVNQQLVHTPASDYQLQDGDLLTVDIGMKYPAQGKGFFTDMARTIGIGKISPEAQKLIDVTRDSLEKGLAQVKAGNTVKDISKAVQDYIESHGFAVVRQLVGHGVGYAVHEEPRVPNFVDPRHTKVELKTGMVLAIEPMVNAGSFEVTTSDDGWTVETLDGSLSAHFEDTVAVTEKGVSILTR